MAENKQAAPNSGDLATEIKSSASSVSGKDIQATKPSRRGWFLSLFLLLFIAAVVAANYWFFEQLRALRQTQNDFLSQLQDQDQRLLDLDTHPAITGLYQQQENFLQGFDTRLENYDQQLAVLDAASQRAYDAAMRSDLDWSIAEIEYLFRLASYRLGLLDDVNGALAALKAADTALRRLADPALLPLRKQLNADMLRLRSLEVTDIPGIAIKLSGLISQVSSLVFNEQSSNLDESGNNNNDSGFWDKIKTLVVVRKANESITSSAQENQEIRELLVYMLTAARAAALRGDEPEYQQQLSSVRQQIMNFFAIEHDTSQNFLHSLDELQASHLRIVNQDINASLKLLQQYTATFTVPVAIDKPQ